MSSKPAKCDYCGKIYGVNKSLNLHLRKVHNISRYDRSATIMCGGKDCVEKFRTHADLRRHVESTHGINIIKKQLTFYTFEDFKVWLAAEEMKTYSKFIKCCKARSSKRTGIKVQKLFCHRSGVFKSKSRGIRQLKSQGTCKTGFTCTASIEVQEIDSKVSVQFFCTHFGHEVELGHLKISEKDREEITGKLAMDISKTSILKSIRTSVDCRIERLHLITRKDLTNICYSYGISEGSSNICQNDAISVDAWVEDQKLKVDDNCVLFYKQQQSEYPPLRTEDFMLVTMSNTQKVMFDRFGPDRLCIDVTHGLTGYDFLLISILVIDEYEEGFPVAFCISSTENINALKVFFSCIKDKLGPLSCKVFMSDDAPAYINAWTDVMGPPERQLLCAWHVDRNWQGHLNTIKSLAKRKEIYKHLKSCLYELEIDTFKKMFQELLNQLKDDPDTETFYQYMNQYYSNRVHVWAYAYRLGAKINTNMHIENFHNKIKTIYLNEKHSKRVDKCINALNDFLLDKEFDRLIKINKGKQTYKISNLVSRHGKGLNMDMTCKRKSNTSWTMPSETKMGKSYEVLSKNEHHCNEEGCMQFGACYKSFSCECHDFQILGNVCKHLHAVKVSIDKEGTSEKIKVENKNLASVLTSSNTKSESDLQNIINLTTQVNAVLQNAASTSKSYDLPILSAMSGHLKAVKQLACVSKVVVVNNLRLNECTQKELHNKSAEKPKRFISIKKKSKKFILEKPDTETIRDSQSTLLQKEFLINDGSLDHKYV